MLGKQVGFLALGVLLALPVLWSSLPGVAAQGQRLEIGLPTVFTLKIQPTSTSMI